MVDREMISYIRQFIEENDPTGSGLETQFPFRQLSDHCYRVYQWAQRICEVEGGDRSIVEISALFHDVGKSIDRSQVGHARKGAEITGAYLHSISYDSQKSAIICGIVENHIYHDNAESLEARIESDADFLDEVGALTVLWDSMDAGTRDRQSYLITYERIREAYRRLERNQPRLHTRTAQRFYKERLDFLSCFLINLSYELGLV